MPDCSSEEEQQFGSMVGGASQPPFDPDGEFGHNPLTSVKPIFANNLNKVVPDEDFKDTLDKIRSFQQKFGNGLQGCRHVSLCVYTDRWISLNDFNKYYRDAADKVDKDELDNAINEMGKKISQEELDAPIRNILASIILQSPNEKLLIPAQNVSKKCRIISDASRAAGDITTSIVARLWKHYELEELQDLSIKMINKWKDSIVIVIKKLAELNLGEFFSGTTKNIIRQLIELKLIGLAYQLTHYFGCDNNSYMKIFAGYALSLFAMKILKEMIKQATPSDESIQTMKSQMDEAVDYINNQMNSIVNDLNSNLPAEGIAKKIADLRIFIKQNSVKNDTLSSAYIEAADNACEPLELFLANINKVSKDAVNPKELGKIKSLLIQLTTGGNKISQAAAANGNPMDLLPGNQNNGDAIIAAAKLREEAEKVANQDVKDELEHQADIFEQQATKKPQKKRKRTEQAAATPTPAKNPVKRARMTRGGAPKRITKKLTKKVKSKMLKGKSKKHLTKAKKSKKTGKKVRFHSSSKKSKKTTRKKR